MACENCSCECEKFSAYSIEDPTFYTAVYEGTVMRTVRCMYFNLETLYGEDKGEHLFFPRIEFSIYSAGSCKKFTLKEKLQHIWKIIRDGTPYEDYITIGEDDIVKMRDYLSKTIEMFEEAGRKEYDDAKTELSE